MKKEHFFKSGLVILAIFLSSHAYTQKVDYNKIILPNSARDISLEERLVQLAWENNPENKILANNIDIATHDVRLTKAQWLDLITLSGNVNEFAISPTTEFQRERAQFFPLYNINLSLRLSTLLTNPQKTKIAYINLQNQQQNLNLQRLHLRSEVLTMYENLKQSKEILGFQLELTENFYNAFVMAEDNFKKGQIDINQYNQRFEEYKNAQIRQRNLETGYNTAQLQLEEMIGVELETVLEEFNLRYNGQE